MGWKKFFIGEPMPDKDDPKYKKRYEREFAAGQRFARITGITWCAGKVQNLAMRHQRVFLYGTFVVVALLFIINVIHIVHVVNRGFRPVPSAVVKVDSALVETNRFNHLQR